MQLRGGAFFENIIGDRVGWGGGDSYQMMPSLISVLWHARKGIGTLFLKIWFYDGRGGALTSNAVLIMLFDATCCLHSFLLFTCVSRGLASSYYWCYRCWRLVSMHENASWIAGFFRGESVSDLSYHISIFYIIRTNCTQHLVEVFWEDIICEYVRLQFCCIQNSSNCGLININSVLTCYTLWGSQPESATG